ncbi:hypothetical protein DFH08DRAFT_814052 [Mycena albidolilacea]|uniref:Uncharacterized protein n=1 Tax=Mycena albidolilacea TaxID=1033008 RepID=A0AAD6ZQ33_9AGAR|nr:hypothetical protein DFH08DRAFT_814052 [Mycena albidolilacea]
MPVLLLQVNSPDTLRWQSAREQADSENRRRLRDLRPLCPLLPKLYAVSAFCTKLRFYAATKTEGVVPPVSPCDPRTAFADTNPPNRWNSDVLEEEGANLPKQSVAEIIARIYLSDVKSKEEGANLPKQSVAEIIARIYLSDGALVRF